MRLVPPALAVWTAAASTLGLPGRWVAAVAVACLVPAVVLLVAASRTSREGRPAGRSRVVAAGGAVLLCAAAGAAVAGLHGADVRRGPVPGLAEEYARIDADVRVTSDPRTTRPAVRGNHSAPALLLIDAEVMEVRTPSGTGTRVRTPVLLMVAAGDHPAGRPEKLTAPPRPRGGPRAPPPPPVA
ncbi:MBL fold metallo-hydrolase, partial [Streptomyces anulatus]